MEPVSLGIAAAALLASKFGEGFAKNAGDSTWNSVKNLRKVIAAKLGQDAESASALTAFMENSVPQNQVRVAECVAFAARSDPDFAREVYDLLAAAREDRAMDLIIAQAFGEARQINIHGDNSGTINVT